MVQRAQAWAAPRRHLPPGSQQAAHAGPALPPATYDALGLGPGAVSEPRRPAAARTHVCQEPQQHVDEPAEAQVPVHHAKLHAVHAVQGLQQVAVAAVGGPQRRDERQRLGALGVPRRLHGRVRPAA